MQIEVTHNETELSRDFYRFYWSEGNGFRFTFFSTQTRATKRHKWTGPFWDSDDERGYHSKLPRPADISPEVLRLAMVLASEQVMASKVFIGWYNVDHELKR
jgi:hypothetical protein